MRNGSGISFATVILAAGASRRMGQPKMLLPWGATSVIGHIISQWTELGAKQITVVVAPSENPVTQELDRLKFPATQRIFNAHPEEGMFSSIQCAARWPHWKPDLTHWIIVLGDQPQISAGTFELLLEHTARNPEAICQLTNKERPKHPIALPHSAFQLLGVSSGPTLREFLESSKLPRALCECSDESLNMDLDYPEDYELARKRFGS